jgi:type I restriction enzyme, S subunit
VNSKALKPLRQLANINRGISWASSQETREPDENSIPVLRIGNVQERLILDDLLYLNNISERQRSENTAGIGSVVMVGSNGNPNRIGNCCLIDQGDGYLFASFLIGFVPNRDQVDPTYLSQVLRSPDIQSAISKSVTGSTGLANLSLEFLRELSVYSPPKHKQTAIARVLVTVDTAIKVTEALLAKKRRIKTGIIHDLLTRGLDAKGRLRNYITHQFKETPIGTIPESWDVCALETLVPRNTPICYGIVQVGTHSPYGVPTIAIRDFADINPSTLHRTAAEIERGYTRSRCVEGDLLLSIKATTGEVTIAPPGFKGNISRDVARIRLRLGEVPAFFKYQLQSEAGQRRLDEITVGTTRREISIAPLRKLLVARPHPEEQRAIATKIESVESELKALSVQHDKLRLIKNGLMQDLLTNRVSVIPLLQEEATAESGQEVATAR